MMSKRIFCLLLGCIGSALKSAQVLYIRTDVEAIKGSKVTIECGIRPFDAAVFVYKSTEIAYNQSHAVQLCSKDKECYDDVSPCKGCTFWATNTSIFIRILQLNRTSHQQYWTCASDTNKQSMYLTINYTVPSNITLEQPSSDNKDLSLEQVNLTCRTDCVAPEPHISWFYTENGRNYIYKQSSIYLETHGTCEHPEKIYNSRLLLAANLTWPDNLGMTVVFKCGITKFTGLKAPLYSQPSTKFSFAVTVSSIELREHLTTTNATSNITLTIGVQKTLHCILGAHRPAATVTWYIGNVLVQMSNTNYDFVLVPKESHHNQEIYCSAFNLQLASEAIQSKKYLLSVTGSHQPNTSYPHIGVVYAIAAIIAVIEVLVIAVLFEKKTGRHSEWFRRNIVSEEKDTEDHEYEIVNRDGQKVQLYDLQIREFKDEHNTYENTRL